MISTTAVISAVTLRVRYYIIIIDISGAYLKCAQSIYIKSNMGGVRWRVGGGGVCDDVLRTIVYTLTVSISLKSVQNLFLIHSLYIICNKHKCIHTNTCTQWDLNITGPTAVLAQCTLKLTKLQIISCQ